MKRTDKPLARPTIVAAEPQPRKLSAKERKIAERDSPKVAQARLVLDSLSESLAPAPDAAEAIMAHAEKTLAAGTKRCAYHRVVEPVAAFSKNVTHSDGLTSSCREAQKIQRAGRTKAAK